MLGDSPQCADLFYSTAIRAEERLPGVQQLFFLYYFTRFREGDFITPVRICFSRESNISVFSEGVPDVLAPFYTFSQPTEPSDDENTMETEGGKNIEIILRDIQCTV